MGRRERPNVKGTDPAYSHTFQTERPRLPNGMPPSVVIPGLSEATPKADPPAREDEPLAEPAPDPGTADRAAKATEPAAGSRPEAKAETPRSSSKPGKRARPKRQPISSAPSTDGAADDASTGEKRKVSIKVSITTAHAEAMKPLVAAGLAQRDVLALAGRRTMRRFEPTPEFVPVPDGDRVPMTVAYSTTKYVSAQMLDGMRDVHDPLRVKSDAAMVRGQFETLFWSVLDEVIEELRDRRG